METIKKTWKGGLAGKLIILFALVLLCSVPLNILRSLSGSSDATTTPSDLAALTAQSPAATVTSTTSPTFTPVPTAQPTNTPLPTDTPIPTNTPEPTAQPISTPLPTDTPIPTNTPEPAQRIENAVREVLGNGNRDVPRLQEFDLQDDGIIWVVWSINDELWIKLGAMEDIAEILGAIKKSGVDYTRVDLLGTFSMKDSLGVSERTVISVSYYKPTVDSIDWDRFLYTNVYDVADKILVIHPEFER